MRRIRPAPTGWSTKSSRKGGKAVAIQANVAKGADVKRLFAETKAKLGAPSILVNNAGVFSFAPIEAVTEEDVERQFDTNVLGTLLASKETVAAFDGAGGSIINLSTIASVNPVPNSVVYSASKAAVDTITRALASSLRQEDPRQRDRAGHDRDGGYRKRWAHDGGRQSDGHGHAGGPHGPARRHRPGGAVPCLGPVVLAHRGAHFGVRRTAVGAGLTPARAAPATKRRAGARLIVVRPRTCSSFIVSRVPASTTLPRSRTA